MHRFLATLIVCVFTAGLTGVALAQSEEKGGVWYLRGSFGVANHDLSELETSLKEQKQDLIDRGVNFSTYARNFDTILDYRVEVGAIFWKGFSLGLLFNYQPRGEDQVVGGSSPGDQYRSSENIEINFLAFYGNLCYWLPGDHGFFLGGRVGYSHGRFKQSITITNPSVPQFTATVDGDYDGAGAVYGLSAGYQYTFLNGILVYLELGYEARNLGTFTGSTTSTDEALFPSSSGDYTVNGQTVDFDYSGPFIAIGIGFTGPY